jgi:transposase
MFPVSSSSRLFVYNAPADMRKSFDGLSGLVVTQMKADPLSGDVYLFINRRRDRLKMLVWERGGFWLFYKRLESGRFQLPVPGESEISYQTLVMMLDGIDYTKIKRKKRYTGQKRLELNS